MEDDLKYSPESQGSFYRYGSSLVIGDFEGFGYADLAVGEPGALVNNEQRAGRVEVIFTRNNELFAAGFESGNLNRWSQ